MSDFLVFDRNTFAKHAQAAGVPVDQIEQWINTLDQVQTLQARNLIVIEPGASDIDKATANYRESMVQLQFNRRQARRAAADAQEQQSLLDPEEDPPNPCCECGCECGQKFPTNLAACPVCGALRP